MLQALFAAYTKKVNPKIKFIYTADGGNAGIKDVQNGTSQFAGQARTPLPSDAGTTYIKLYLDGLCIDVNPKNKLTNISTQSDSTTSTVVSSPAGPRFRAPASPRRSTRSGVTPTEGPTTSSSSRC